MSYIIFDQLFHLTIIPPKIDATNALNLKLFPTYPDPQAVYDYQVPICTVDLNTLIDMNWDITVKKVGTR
jgi:nitrogen permease regulator 2-like protein